MNVQWLRSNRILVSLLIATLLATGLLALVVARQHQGDQTGNRPVYLEAAEDPGLKPFVPLDAGKPEVRSADEAESTVPDSAGTDNQVTCDPERLIAYLAAHSAEASAWIQALNSDHSLTWGGGNQISLEQIPAYIRELTPQPLSDDLGVTNYQFENGKPIAVQSVLQKGTAVLIDKSGVSRVRCACGNPLTPMVQSSKPPAYSGKPWPDFRPIKIVIIERDPDRRCGSDEYFDGRQCRPATLCPPGQYLAPNSRCYYPPDRCPAPLLRDDDGRCYHPPDPCPPHKVPGPKGCYVPPCERGEKRGFDGKCVPPESPCGLDQKAGPDGSCLGQPPSGLALNVTGPPVEELPEPVEQPVEQDQLVEQDQVVEQEQVKQPVKESVKEPVEEPVEEPVKEPVKEPVEREQVKQPVERELVEPPPAVGQRPNWPKACIDLDSDEVCDAPRS